MAAVSSEIHHEVRARAVLDQLGRAMRDLRISVTDHCNLRCPYCMPAEVYGEHYSFLPREAILTFEEIARAAGAAVALGVEKIRLTGGEPLLRKNIDRLVAMLRAIPGVRDLALTTNGLLLPQHARALKAAGLDRVTVSLDSLDDAVYARMSGRTMGPAQALAGIEAALEAGLTPLKINCVVVRGVNEAGVLDLVARFRGTGCTVRFIEFMDVGTLNRWRRAEVVPSRALLARIAERWPLHPVAERYRGEVADYYAFDDGAGEVGFISSVTQPFCGDCSRLRLSAEGKLYTCLFGHVGHDLRDALRGEAADEELTGRIAAIWAHRADRYSEERAGLAEASRKVEMFQIGG